MALVNITLAQSDGADISAFVLGDITTTRLTVDRTVISSDMGEVHGPSDHDLVN